MSIDHNATLQAPPRALPSEDAEARLIISRPRNVLCPRKIELDPHCTIITDPSRISEDHQHDESKFMGEKPITIAFPKTVEQLAFALEARHQNSELVTISGRRTGVVGGASPSENTHVISLEQLIGIESIVVPDGEPALRVKAGTSLEAISQYITANHPRYYYPVDPTCQYAAIGGNVATNAGGARSYHYGSTRDQVLALTVALADGTVLDLKRGESEIVDGRLVIQPPDNSAPREILLRDLPLPAVKHSLGPEITVNGDPIDLFIGSEGILGVVAEVEIKLALRPAKRMYHLQFFSTEESAIDYATDVQKIVKDLGFPLLAVEFIDEKSLAIALHSPNVQALSLVNEERQKVLKKDYNSAVFIDINLLDESDDSFDRVAEAIIHLVESNKIRGNVDHAISGTDEATLANFKVLRHGVPEQVNERIRGLKREAPELHKISTDMTAPPEAIPALTRYYRKILGATGFEHYLFGHYGSGHLHLNIVPRDAAQLHFFKSEIYPRLAAKVVSLGGSVSGEHGIGRLKRDLLLLQYSTDDTRMLRELRSFFDPTLQLNPEVLLFSPDEEHIQRARLNRFRKGSRRTSRPLP